MLGTYLFIGGDIGLIFMPMEFHNAIKFSLAPIALFLLMGEILLQTGVAFRAINAIDRMISRVPDGCRSWRSSAAPSSRPCRASTIANTARWVRCCCPT
ncbi:MAG: hypothetical protein R3E48_18285 [Burkholderiaceae bacterium]